MASAPVALQASIIFEPTNDALLSNPLAEIVPGAQIDNIKKYRIFNSLYANVKITDGLSYRVNFGPDFTNQRGGRFIGSLTNARRRGDATAATAASNKLTKHKHLVTDCSNRPEQLEM